MWYHGLSPSQGLVSGKEDQAMIDASFDVHKGLLHFASFLRNDAWALHRKLNDDQALH